VLRTGAISHRSLYYPGLSYLSLISVSNVSNNRCLQHKRNRWEFPFGRHSQLWKEQKRSEHHLTPSYVPLRPVVSFDNGIIISASADLSTKNFHSWTSFSDVYGAKMSASVIRRCSLHSCGLSVLYMTSLGYRISTACSIREAIHFLIAVPCKPCDFSSI
jgi:hypothetical protein